MPRMRVAETLPDPCTASPSSRRSPERGVHRIVVVYAAFGVVIGFIFLPLIPLVRLIGLPRDTSVGIAAFGLMPLLIVTMGVVCPRLPVNLVGVTVAVMGCAFGYAVASLFMGFGVSSIGYGMTIMGAVLVPGYIVLALVVFVVRARNSGHP